MRTKKRFLSILLSLTLILGMMQGTCLTVYAGSTVTWATEDISGINIVGEGSKTISGITVTLSKSSQGANCSFSSSVLGLSNGGCCMFSPSQGGISEISIQADDLREPDEGWPTGWSSNGSTLTWSGDSAVEVVLDSEYYLEISEIQQITFTLSDTGIGVKSIWNNETIEVNGNVTLNRRIKVIGDVILKLNEGAKLTAGMGINVPSGNSLTIQGSGELVASVGDDSQWKKSMACIGGNRDQTAGTITITGGTIEARGGANGAGIGGGSSGDGGTVNISGGKVTAIGGSFGAGIGGGSSGGGGTVNISGGTVIATGGKYNCAGIGRGGYGNSDGTLPLLLRAANIIAQESVGVVTATVTAL